MNNNFENRMIPILRFPEFQDADGWEEMLLGNLGQTINGLTGKSGSDFGAGKPYVTYKQVFDDAYINFAKCGKVLITDTEKQNILKHGDILFTTSSETAGEVGFASVILHIPKENIYLNSFCFSFRPNDLNKLLPEFSRYFFHSPIYRKLISVLAQGSTRYNISKSAFLNLKLPLSTIQAEQQKIASCLAALDDVITAASQKLDALKTHKSGLMQQLFPADGETVPQLRFPEFRESDEWEEKTLGEICYNIASGKDKSKIGGKYDLYGSTGIIGKTDSDTFEGNYILIARVGANAGQLNKVNRVNHKFGVTDNTLIVYLNLSENIDFIFYSLDNFGLNKMVFGSGQPLITGGQLKALVINLPSSAEQQKIASCLRSLDDYITTQTDRLAALKVHKQGLMQQLFPNPLPTE